MVLYTAVALVFVSSLAVNGLMFFLSMTLRKRLDPIYFNERHFSESDLIILSRFPGSLFRTLYYVLGVTIPWATRKQFKYARLQDDIPWLLWLLSWMVVFFLVSGCLGLILLFVPLDA